MANINSSGEDTARNTGLGDSSPEKMSPDIQPNRTLNAHHVTQDVNITNEYVTNTGTTSSKGAANQNGVSSLTPNVALIARIPSPPPDIKYDVEKISNARKSALSRYPSQVIRMSTVSMSSRTKPGNRAGSSIYYSSTPKWKKVVTWKEATDCRPPMRIDMEGPTPCSYSPRNKPLNETNSPCYTFGSNCFRDKDVKEGARTSWAKTWFQGPEVFNYKADFFSDRKWPTPASYKTMSLLGPRQRTFPSYPAHTIAERGKNYIINKQGSENEPAPWEYDVAKADKLTLKRGSSYSLTPRQSTQLWGPIEKTPGPGEYEPKLSQSKKMFPAFTVNGIRREKSQALGPFSTF